MATNKNQHFVPKLYLRKFSENQKSVELYLPKSSKLIKTASIKDECSKDYYYGQDYELALIESYFKILEGSGTAALKDPVKFFSRHTAMMKTAAGREEWEKFLSFVMIQEVRTPAYDDDHTMIWDMLNEILPARTNKIEKGYYFGFDQRPALNVYMGLPRYAFVCDLMPILIAAPTDHTFLTSDNPVVKTNFAALTGLVKDCAYYLDEAGLTIFYPLSPHLGLLLVDRHVYRWPKRSFPIQISTSDLDTLNLLQFQNFESSIYGQCLDRSYLEKLRSQARFLRPRELIVDRQERQTQEVTDHGDQRVIPINHYHNIQPRPVNKLSFLRVQPRPRFLATNQWLERDIRFRHPGPAAQEFAKLLESDNALLWHFSKFIEENMLDRGLSLPPRFNRRPYEVHTSNSRKFGDRNPLRR